MFQTCLETVIPAKAGIQTYRVHTASLVSGFRRNDDFRTSPLLIFRNNELQCRVMGRVSLFVLFLVLCAYFVLFSTPAEKAGKSEALALDDLTLEEIAERFFPLFIEGKEKSILQSFEMSDAIRSFIGSAKHRTAIRTFQRLFGGVGELQKKEIIRHTPINQSVELFYSGKTNCFKARVSFEGNQIAGVHYFPWADEQAHGGTPIQLETPTGIIYGTLLEPEQMSETVPVVLFLAGSGPTDRNGNNPMGLRTDSYRLLAEALQEYGIASIRFDKRGIGASAAAGTDESKLRFEHFVDDAVLWIDLLSQKNKYSKIIVLGHSEGSLVGMLACIKSEKSDGFISLAGAGRPIDEIIREQVSGQLQLLFVRNRLFSILDELKQGRTVNNVPASLLSLVRPSVQPYMISWMKYDPRTEIQKLTIPILIVQGTTDIQVSVVDAKSLSEANPRGKKVIIEGMDHLLKTNSVTWSLFRQGSDTDPKRPLHGELMPRITEFIAGIE